MDIKVLNDQEQARREKLPKYRELGVDPFGQSYKVSHQISDIRLICGKKSAKALEKLHLEVSIAGRIKALRKMGKASFVNIIDKTGKIIDTVAIHISQRAAGGDNQTICICADQ